MQDAGDLDAIRDPIKDDMRVNEDRPQPRNELVSRSSHQWVSSEPRSDAPDFARYFIRDIQ